MTCTASVSHVYFTQTSLHSLRLTLRYRNNRDDANTAVSTFTAE